MVVDSSPLVSIITPVYNGSEYLDALIQSVLNQNYPNVEHIIIDDGSRDNGATVAVLRKYPHLHWWSRPNQGQYATMNEGLLAAQGEIVCFISADDIMAPGAIHAVAEILARKPSWDAVFGTTSYIDANGNRYPYPVPMQRAPISFVIYFAHVPHCSFYVKRLSLFNQRLLFNPFFQFVGDYEWMIRIGRSKLRVGTIRQELSRVRIHPNQATQKYIDRSMIERQLVLATYPVNKLWYRFLSGIHFFEFRVWKLALVFKSNGFKGIWNLIGKWYKIKFV
jgi:glycosyltransferase involved in cell wall biosynthesis